MSFLRNVLHDLVEKKLWPVAVALLAALVAVPVVLGGSSGGDPVDAPIVAGTPSGTPGTKVASLEQNKAKRVYRTGKGVDPFVQHHLPKPKPVTTEATTEVPAAAPGGGTPDSGTSTPTPTTPAPTAKPTDTYDVSLRFGEVGQEKDVDGIERLTPLPSSADPFFVFMGVKDDGKTAVFLISSDAVPNGDGTCYPSADECETLELQEGDTEYFDLQTGTAGVVQYQLTLTAIDKGTEKTTAKAAAAHVRENAAGRDLLREAVAADPSLLDAWSYSSRLGVLVMKAGTKPGEKATVSTSASGVGAAAAVPTP